MIGRGLWNHTRSQSFLLLSHHVSTIHLSLFSISTVTLVTGASTVLVFLLETFVSQLFNCGETLSSCLKPILAFPWLLPWVQRAFEWHKTISGGGSEDSWLTLHLRQAVSLNAALVSRGLVSVLQCPDALWQYGLVAVPLVQWCEICGPDTFSQIYRYCIFPTYLSTTVFLCCHAARHRLLCDGGSWVHTFSLFYILPNTNNSHDVKTPGCSPLFKHRCLYVSRHIWCMKYVCVVYVGIHTCVPINV